MGIFAGAYGGATLVSGYASVSFNPQLALEGAAGQFLGRYSNGYTGRHRPDARVRARVALVAIPHARPRRGAHRAQGHAGAARPFAASSRPTSAAAYATTSRGASSCAPSTRPTRCSPSATRTRKLTNGKWDSRSSSDGCSRAARGAQRLRLGAPLVPRARRRRRRCQRHRRSDQAPPRVVEPEVARRKIKVPRIRSSQFRARRWTTACCRSRISARTPPYGLTAAYHVTEDFFFQAEPGRATRRAHQFRAALSNVQLLTESERRFTYYDLSLGYNFLPGEAFIGRGLAMTSAFYILGGIGSTDFAGDKKFTVNFGAGYRVVPADWLARAHRRCRTRCSSRAYSAPPSSPITSRRASVRPSSSRGTTHEEPVRSLLQPPCRSPCPRWRIRPGPRAAVHPRRPRRRRT